MSLVPMHDSRVVEFQALLDDFEERTRNICCDTPPTHAFTPPDADRHELLEWVRSHLTTRETGE